MKATMKLTHAVLAVLLAASVLMLAPRASATTVDECTTAIGVVKGDLAGVEIGGRHPDQTRASLDSKLDGAILKLQQGKFSDALQKLNDFKSKILDLQAEGKISDSTMGAAIQTLLTDTDAAIACVNNLMAAQ